jgi:hypothetical protein
VGAAQPPRDRGDHDLVPGGAVTYVLTGPHGERSRGWWRVTWVDPPTSLGFIDGVADHHGTPVAGGSTDHIPPPTRWRRQPAMELTVTTFVTMDGVMQPMS